MMKSRFLTLKCSWIKLLIILFTAFLSISIIFPVKVSTDDTQSDQFSAERAMQHLQMIARQPHPSGSQAQAEVRDYLVQQLSDLGLEVELQQKPKVDNVITRIYGSNPSGAILILAHYDSVSNSPGAADNGSGVAVLLEFARALVSGPKPKNDEIILFDDSEELPDEFTGSKLFVREHRWMPDVKVAISLDTAVNGPISINETGDDNGWLVKVLARSYTNGAWSSMSGGGNYDVAPFQPAGVQVLAMEDNYPFKEKHTKEDVIDIVNPVSVQQMGDQILAISREMGSMDLSDPRGAHETFFPIPYLALVHYPQSWSLPLAIIAAVLFCLGFGLAIWRKVISWRGVGFAFAATLLTTALSALVVGWVLPQLPDLMGWEVRRWPDWPEVIPPYAGWVDIVFAILILALFVYVYRFTRRWSSPTAFSLAGLFILWLPALVTALSEPRATYLFVWPVLIGSFTWVTLIFWKKVEAPWVKDVVLLMTALSCVVLILPFLPGIVMSDGMKSLALLSAVWAILLSIILPALDELIIASEGRINTEILTQ
jgi:hypothetical protein